MTKVKSKKTKALVYHGPRQMMWEDWPINEPREGEVLVKVRAVGICGSDIHGYTGESGRRIPPMVMGHEAAGEVAAVGAGVSTNWLNRRIIIQPFVACGTCEFCRGRRSNLCRNRKFFGASITGAMAENLIVPAANLIMLPPHLPFEYGTLSEPLSVAIHAVSRAGDLNGCSVMVAGGGPIGLFTMKAARQAGARVVVVTDLASDRLDLAIKMGADAAIDPRTENIKQRLAEVVGADEVDVAFDAVGIQPTFDQALKTVKPGGVVIAIGGWKIVSLNLGPVVAREVDIRGTFNFTMQEFEQAVSWLEKKIIDPMVLPVQTYPMGDGAEVFEHLSGQPDAALKVVLTL